VQQQSVAQYYRHKSSSVSISSLLQTNISIDDEANEAEEVQEAVTSTNESQSEYFSRHSDTEITCTLPGLPSETYKFVRWQLSQAAANGSKT